MTEFYVIFEALANATKDQIIMISQFDILAINPQKLAMLGQLFADCGRVVVDIAKIVISLIQAAKG